jgi:hypothetical protein
MTRHHPDWQKSDNYPPMPCKDLRLLAWEFLRRNEFYAAHVEQMQKLAEGEYRNGLKRASDSSLNGLVCWPPAEPGECARQYYSRTNDKKTGKKGVIILPWKTFVNRWSLEDPVPVGAKYDRTLIRFVPHDVSFIRNRTLQAQLFRLVLFSNEVAFRFRVDRRPEPQLLIAKKKLERAAEEFDKVRYAADGVHAKDGFPLFSLREFRKARTKTVKDTDKDKSTLEEAHYWLRCYDAFSPKSPQASDKQVRTIPTEAEVRNFLNGENEHSAKSISRGVPLTYRNSAAGYIDDMKYLLLLD